MPYSNAERLQKKLKTYAWLFPTFATLRAKQKQKQKNLKAPTITGILIRELRRTLPKTACLNRHTVCDRGYRGKKTFDNTKVPVILPSSPLKKDDSYQRDKK